MEYRQLGTSDLEVSRICLGTMTWGTQNSQQDADQQIDYALDQGINFIDTAEMYSIPPNAESYGKTETIIGNWLAKNQQRRQDFVLASKIAGRGLPYIRGGEAITGNGIRQAIDDSLGRLQTDCIDLYQLHWPNRHTPHFNRHKPGNVPFNKTQRSDIIDDMHDQLSALAEYIQAGKIRYVGLSNETPWGISQFVRLAEQHQFPRVVSVQNEFNLLHSKDYPYLLETCVREDVSYLAWSPLAAGALSGKYLNGQRPAGSRWTFPQRNGLFRDTEAANAAVTAYSEIAARHGISTAQLALKWCDDINEVASTIIGATSMEQLREDIAAFELSINDELREEIAAVKQRYPAPF